MASLKTAYRRQDNFLRNWGAVLLLFIFFFASWAGHYFTQLEAEKLDSRQHGEVFDMSEFWPKFWSSTLENWQSEWLQLATQAILITGWASYVFRKGEEQHFKTHLLIEELKQSLDKKR